VEKSRAHLPLTCVQEGIPLSLMVKSHLHGGRLLGQTRKWPALRSKAFQLAFTDRGPRQQKTHALRPKRGYARGRRGRPSRPPFHLPLTRRRKPSRDPRPLFPHRPTGDASLSLSPHSSAWPRWRNDLPPTLGHPWMDRCPATHHNYPKDPAQNHESSERKESQKPQK
jgi:hypothetical protein